MKLTPAQRDYVIQILEREAQTLREYAESTDSHRLVLQLERQARDLGIIITKLEGED